MPNLARAALTSWMLLSFAVLPFVSGCGAPKCYPVKGQVLLFGVGFLPEGEVRFQPVSKPDLIATGRIQKDGTFSLATPSQSFDDLLATPDSISEAATQPDTDFLGQQMAPIPAVSNDIAG